jgi:hypothetical protein
VIDNDDAGHQQGQKKAIKARASGVTHIRIFDPKTVWLECPDGGDVSDWFEHGGGTIEKLKEIVDTLPNWKPMSNDDDGPESDEQRHQTDGSQEMPSAAKPRRPGITPICRCWMIVVVNCQSSRSMCFRPAGKSGRAMTPPLLRRPTYFL